MNKKVIILAAIVTAFLLAMVLLAKNFLTSGPVSQAPTPTPASVPQLEEDQYPQVSLDFSADGHYVTVNISNLHAAALEYNLIYDATVKDNAVNTGVTGSAKIDGQDEYSYKQLLGSESSGKFTYHQNIDNAVMELTLRDANRYSIYSATYPFEVEPGETVELTTASEI